MGQRRKWKKEEVDTGDVTQSQTKIAQTVTAACSDVWWTKIFSCHDIAQLF